MTYEVSIDLVEILRTTLHLLDHTEYAGKTSNSVQGLRACLVETIAELEESNAKAASENAADGEM
jgi:hypothetical protein